MLTFLFHASAKKLELTQYLSLTSVTFMNIVQDPGSSNPTGYKSCAGADMLTLTSIKTFSNVRYVRKKKQSCDVVQSMTTTQGQFRGKLRAWHDSG